MTSHELSNMIYDIKEKLTDKEFKEWAESEDIRRARPLAFEEEELFDHCIILKRVLETKEK